jgi:hypothetical protein
VGRSFRNPSCEAASELERLYPAITRPILSYRQLCAQMLKKVAEVPATSSDGRLFDMGSTTDHTVKLWEVVRDKKSK